MGLAAVKVSVTGDTMLDVPVSVETACVVVLLSRGNSREVDVEEEALDITPFPGIDVWVNIAEPGLELVKDPEEPVLLEDVPLELLELLDLEALKLEMLGLKLLELELLEVDVEEDVELVSELVG